MRFNISMRFNIVIKDFVKASIENVIKGIIKDISIMLRQHFANSYERS